MIGDTENPFDALDLPPTASPEDITEALRERIEGAAPAERAGLRALWERLLRHPRDRVLLALGAHPRAAGAAQPPERTPPADAAAVAAVAAFVTPPDELVPLPLASAAASHPPPPDPLAVLAAELAGDKP